MIDWQVPVTKPWETLQGHDDDGKFKTAKAKEYPFAMCGAIAQAVEDYCISRTIAQNGIVETDQDSFDAEEVERFFVPLDPYYDVETGNDYVANWSCERPAHRFTTI